MDLSRALRLSGAPCLALVGAGGKTTALFRLARELAGSPHRKFKTVIVTTTTHLAIQQLDCADHHTVVQSPDDLRRLEESLPNGVVVLTGLRVESERVSGPPVAVLERLRSLTWKRELPLLVEADGARQRPLKAPLEHEPVIPDWVDQVVVLVGLSGLGKPLDQHWVHRPERFGELSGLSLGLPVSIEALEAVLTHPNGGLKGIPPGARRAVLLNQADTPELRSAGFRLAESLLKAYPAVLISALKPGGEDVIRSTAAGESEWPVFAVRELVAGIILAAGESARLGQPKQLLAWRGETLVRHVARVALQAGLSPVTLVVGPQAGEVRSALEGLGVRVVDNPDWAAGQSTSIQAGLQAVGQEVGAAIFLLVDQPFVSVELVRGLVERHSQTLSPLVAPLVDSQRANPVLFDRVTFPDLLALTGDTGGRVLFRRHPVTWLPWRDARLLLDIDTQDDYQRAVSLDI